MLDFCPEMLYERVSGVSREEGVWSPGFARLVLERLRVQGLSDS